MYAHGMTISSFKSAVLTFFLKVDMDFEFLKFTGREFHILGISNLKDL